MFRVVDACKRDNMQGNCAVEGYLTLGNWVYHLQMELNLDRSISGQTAMTVKYCGVGINSMNRLCSLCMDFTPEITLVGMKPCVISRQLSVVVGIPVCCGLPGPWQQRLIDRSHVWSRV